MPGWAGSGSRSQTPYHKHYIMRRVRRGSGPRSRTCMIIDFMTFRGWRGSGPRSQTSLNKELQIMPDFRVRGTPTPDFTYSDYPGRGFKPRPPTRRGSGLKPSPLIIGMISCAIRDRRSGQT